MSQELSDKPIVIEVGQEEVGTRLDIFLANQFPRYSRMGFRRAINAASISVNGKHAKASYRLRAGERVSVVRPPQHLEKPTPEKIDLEILFEDDHLAAINKPPAMVVHPGRGHWGGTLAAALQYHFDELSSTAGATRPGIVHRLDRDTSGVILVAKHDIAHLNLSAQFANRTTEKEYLAIVAGVPDRDADVIDAPIGVHPYQREKMAIRHDHTTSRSAETFYEVVNRYVGFATVCLRPKTGRTHQIRVHLESIHCPVLCDRQYGGRSRITLGEISGNSSQQEVLLDRQALHARKIIFSHPITAQRLEIVAPIPAEIERVIQALAEFRSR